MPRLSSTEPPSEPSTTLSSIWVEGFKSLAKRVEIELRSLTMLAGANSSGKSSLMQPLLLMKQTLNAPYDPGPLLLDGPNASFSDPGQMFSVGAKSHEMTVGFGLQNGGTCETVFALKPQSKVLDIKYQKYSVHKGSEFKLSQDLSADELQILWDKYYGTLERPATYSLSVSRVRCMLELRLISSTPGKYIKHGLSELEPFDFQIKETLHIPGSRGRPERSYQATGEHYHEGRFPDYTASVLAAWQKAGKDDELTRCNQYLKTISVSAGINAELRSAVAVEVFSKRLDASKRNNGDFNNIADMGFGVSQVLPVVVALVAAKPGQLVYIEQPELHLHPRAQYQLAEVLLDAARRGVRMVIETHSDLLLLGIQTLIAEDTFDKELVRLHWFSRDAQGFSTVTSAELDDEGAFGAWPQDFAEISLKAQARYLDAAESKAFTRGKK